MRCSGGIGCWNIDKLIIKCRGIVVFWESSNVCFLEKGRRGLFGF